jgi:hypothetical protein
MASVPMQRVFPFLGSADKYIDFLADSEWRSARITLSIQSNETYASIETHVLNSFENR